MLDRWTNIRRAPGTPTIFGTKDTLQRTSQDKIITGSQGGNDMASQCASSYLPFFFAFRINDPIIGLGRKTQG